MYRYDDYDQQLVDERVKQYADQTRRYLAGELSEEEYLPLRLQNGLYVQKQAPMLRVAIPYGNLRSDQVRMFAHIARTYDKGYGHFSTRQNIQFNWPKIEDTPQILADLASVQMHAIQTSGNCIRNTTSDPFAGVAADELIDPRPWCELIRQWSTFHPEFAYLPRKFKMAVNGAEDDRAIIRCHDIGLEVRHNDAGELGFRIFVGGGLGRTPMVGVEITDFIPWPHLLTYLEAILRVYNRFGRRDNKYKARIKILVKALGIDAFRAQVEEEWTHLKDGPATLTQEEVDRVAACFVDPDYESLPATNAAFEQQQADNKPFAKWVERNVRAHKRPGYASAVVSLKKTGVPPGDITDAQLDQVADWADRYSFGEVRTTHEQNLVFADVKQSDLFELWQQLRDAGLATPNFGLITDMICCPGGDFCNLANAKSIPIAEAVQRRFDDLDYLYDVGELELNISGCMNACGHHHVGHIGILGVDKNGEEWYQITIGGRQGNEAGIGKVIGRSFAAADVPDVIEKLVATYIDNRHEGERFVDTVHRVGLDPFKTRVYGEQQPQERKVANV